MNDNEFLEIDYSSDDLENASDDEKADLEVFKDPFFEIGPYLLTDPFPEISKHKNLKELTFFLTTAWLDPYFYRNRTLCSLTTNDYLPEEKGLLILIQKLLDLKDKPLDHHLLTVFCMITGRCSELLQFDPITSTNIKTVNFRAPYNLYSLPGEGPCCISPYLIILAVNETVTFPTIISHLQDKTKPDSSTKITTDLNESFEFAQRPPPPPFPLSFDSGLTLTNYITRFPLSNGDFWTRVTCGPFSIAYGDDISNGKGQVKYKWTNRFNGQPPPTLSEDGQNPPVEWIDMPCRDDSLIDASAIEVMSRFCPLHNADHELAFKQMMRTYNDEHIEYTPIWVDEHTSRIKEKDLELLNSADDDNFLIVVECNKYCKCRGNCPCCLSTRPAFPHLMLFYTPEKNWCVAATEDIEPGTLVAFYAGEFKEGKDDKQYSIYYFGIGGPYYNGFGYHAIKKCNIGRFINTAHMGPKESESPFQQTNTTGRNIVSVFFENCLIGIFATRKIFKGEELTISYGGNYEMNRYCACNYCLADPNSYMRIIDGFK